MATNKYIVLENSNSSLSARFKAIDLKVPEQRTDNLRYALDGTPDKASGPILRQFIYVLRVPEDDQGNEYGDMADLRTLWRLTNPSAVPSDVITLTDHYGEKYDCFFTGSMEPTPLTTMLEGSNAWHIVQISLQYIRDNEGS
jgi:hypothetical protein